MEAAATGRPVVAYDIRGVREVIDPGLGLLAPRGDVAALGVVLGDLLDDPDRCDELGKLCRERIVAEFSEDRVVERLQAFYAATFDGRGPRSACRWTWRTGTTGWRSSVTRCRSRPGPAAVWTACPRTWPRPGGRPG
jgi:hypothetical protein